MKQIVFALVASFVLSGCQHVPAGTAPSAAVVTSGIESETAIIDVLDQQALAWNAGDIPGFMEHYWKNDDLRFGSGGNITRGWQATLDRYLRTYSDRAKMGQLAFRDLEIQPLAGDAAVVHGRWRLTRESDTPSGLFTLIFRNFGDGWVIVSDTTTSG